MLKLWYLFTETSVHLYWSYGACLSTNRLNNYVSLYRKVKINKLALNKSMEALKTHSASLVNLKHITINFQVYIQTVFSLHTPTNRPAKIVLSYS